MLMYRFAFNALQRLSRADPILCHIATGEFRHASGLAEKRLIAEHSNQEPAVTAWLAVIAGDLLLAQDRDEEAEECFRRSLRFAANGPRGFTRVLACRNKGAMSLYQRRFGVALACFSRVADDDAADDMLRVEALCAMAVAHHSVGQGQQAFACVGRAAERASDAGSRALEMFVGVVRADLVVQREIRCHNKLADHVFWQTPSQAAKLAREELQPLLLVEGCLSAYADQPLIHRRLEYLRSVLLSSYGDTSCLKRVHDHLALLRRTHACVEEREARLDAALVAVALQNAELARSMIDPLTARRTQGITPRWNFELAYCAAKICVIEGRLEDSFKHYQQYAQESMDCVRCESVMPLRASAGSPQDRAGAQEDELESALPAKYRRAYRYLIEHLDSDALSVHEVAEQIGVTERALQLAFKSHLGMTPAEVMRRRRIERIREDLLRGGVVGSTVTETAARWGIRNRSTLVALYRKHFHETPSETVSQAAERSRTAAPHAA
jgi:AraC-like DNA-binding protein